MAALFVIAGKSRGQVFRIDRPVVVIGRDEGCDLQVLDELVSRRHFEVRAGEDVDAHRAVDLGSSNGTFVGEEQIGEATLKDGDVIRVGESKILFTTREFPDRQTAMDFFKIRGEHDKQTMISPRAEDA